MEERLKLVVVPIGNPNDAIEGAIKPMAASECGLS